MPVKKQKGISFGYCDLSSGQRVYPGVMPDLLPEQLPPAQTVHPLSADGKMFARITCDPPLGQATTIGRGRDAVEFSVLLETNAPSLVDDQDISVNLWHNHGNHYDWAELPLKQSNAFKDVLHVHSSHPVTRRWYTATLPGKPKHLHPVSFTVKFKIGTESGWKWVRDASGIGDGDLHYLREESEKGFSDFFPHASKQFTIQPHRPQTTDGKLWSLTSPASPAKGDDSGYSKHSLGVPASFTRYFALVRLWSPWLAPRHGKVKFEVDKDAVLVSFLRADGLHVVCLAISGVGNVLSVFTHDGDGNVIVQARNDLETEGKSQVLVAVADEFEVANAAVMYHARRMVMGQQSTTGELKAEEEAFNAKKDEMHGEWLEEWYDGLTYCTWNGLGQDLTEQKIFSALDSLKKEGITISNVIIDDNWQSLAEGETQFDRGWLEFEANKGGFPRGLKATVNDIRSQHPEINHIAVWHAILGYWGGISPDGKIANEYKTTTVTKEEGVAAGDMLVVDASDAQRMYDDFYSFLRNAGIDAVKTDAQFFLDMIVQAPARRALTIEYQDAWTLAHLRHFSSRAISCMSQSPQILFHSQLPTNKPRLLVRNSDDFFPEVPASHPWHIFCNAHNSLLTQHLNVLPDWDMFQTSHPWAGFHAAARCVSGGPIYFTDYPEQHDIALINAMTGKTTRDKTVILRPHTVGKSLNAYVGYEEQALLRVGTYVGFSRTGTSIIGLFNCSSRPLSELIRLADFPGTEAGRYLIRSFGGQISPLMERGEKVAFVGVDVDVQGWEILAAHPVREFEIKSGKVAFANLGLLGKMTGAAAVVNSDVYVEDNGRLRVWTSLKALGVLGLYISGLSRRSIDTDLMVMIQGKPIARECVGAKGDVLELDIEAAWTKGGYKAGWSNEVSIEVFVH